MTFEENARIARQRAEDLRELTSLAGAGCGKPLTNKKEPEPMTALQKLKNLMAAGEHRKALKLAAGWADLGEYKDAIERGWAAYSNPDFYRQIDECPDLLIQHGLHAIRERYNIKPSVMTRLVDAICDACDLYACGQGNDVEFHENLLEEIRNAAGGRSLRALENLLKQANKEYVE